MALAFSSASCVKCSSLPWRCHSAPLDHSRRLLASSSSQMVTRDAPVLRLQAAAQRAPLRRRAQGPVAMASPLDIDTTTTVLGAAAIGALSFGLFRAVVYFRMQYFIAAMLGRHVPRGGARVVDLGIREGRNLYYYPKDTVQVVAVTPKPNVQLLESQAVNAKVPIKIVSDVSGLPANSMDAVVSVYGMADMADEQVASALREAVRVLKPGKPFIYVENVGAENGLVRAAQQLVENVGQLGGGNFRVTRDVLPFVQNTDGLEDLQYETVLGFQDPHLVGIATKKARTFTTTGIGKDRIPKKSRKDRP